jgi:hypothetical protein
MTLDALAQGTVGLYAAYAAVQGPMLAGLARGRARLREYLKSPLLAAPAAALVGVAAALGRSLIASAGLEDPAAFTFVASVALSGTFGYAGGRWLAMAGRQETAYGRGSVLDEAPIARRSSRVGADRTDERAAVHLAGIEVPRSDEAKHFKLIGTTGTGKSTAIRELLGDALARGDRAVVADPDGGYLDRFYDPRRGDVILNPFDPRSRRWDLFGEIDNDYDVEQLARALIPDHAGPERSWRDYARTFFAAVTAQARAAGVRDVGEIYRLLVVAEPAELRVLVHGTPAQPFLDEHNARMFDSVRSVTSAAVGTLQYVANSSAEPLSVRRWIASGDRGVMFLPYAAGQIAALRNTISAWMRLGIFEAMNRGGATAGSPARRPPLWFVVDELDALGPIDGLKDALARLRKFDARCVLGFQSIAQVSNTYGQGEAHTIVENCSNTLILRCSASEGGGTARFASQLIGDREVRRITVSKSRRATEFLGATTRSEHFSIEPTLLPSQIERLPDLHGYLKHASAGSWRRVVLAPDPAHDHCPRAHDPEFDRE